MDPGVIDVGSNGLVCISLDLFECGVLMANLTLAGTIGYIFHWVFVPNHCSPLMHNFMNIICVKLEALNGQKD